MKHRVAMVLASPFPALRGTQAWVSEYSSALIALGHEVHLFCYGKGLGGATPHGLILHRAPIIPGVRADLGSNPSFSRPINDVGLLGALLVRLKSIRPTVLHSHNHEGGIAAGIAGRMLGLPVVHQIHGSLAEELSVWAKDLPFALGIGRVFGSLLDYSVPRLAQRIFTLDAEALSRAWLEHDQVRVLPPGVSMTSDDELKDEPSLPQQEDWVVYPGNLDPYQTLGLLMDAWALVREHNPKARLAIVTHEEPRDILQAMPGIEIFRPRSYSHARALVASARCVVVPRTSGGGYPVKMLNALGAGVPVVVCRAAAKGLGEEEGVSAVEENPRAMAIAINSLLKDKKMRNAASSAAIAFANKHPWRSVAEAAVDVYDSLVR